jgi:C-terminal processing protease CtpA/Prc
MMSLTVNSLQAQNTLLERTVKLFQFYNVNRSTVNWETLKPKIFAKVDSSKYDSAQYIYPAVRLMLDSLNDRHSYFIYKGRGYGLGPKRDKPVSDYLIKSLGNVKRFRTEILDGDIGYINIPGISDLNSKNIDSNATIIQKALEELYQKDIKGIVIDLRLNTGGNVHPMIGGLASLLGSGEIGSLTSGLRYSIKDGRYYMGERKMVDVRDTVSKKMKTVVLTSGLTASSGEITAIVFRGVNWSKSIGEKTAGQPSSNAYFNMEGGTGVEWLISVADHKDRTGKVYKGSLIPDIEIIGGDNFEDLEKDEKVIVALKWLKEK